MTSSEPTIAGDTLCREVVGGVAFITLNRPKALNALTGEQFIVLRRWLEEWAADPSIRAVFVAGAGDKAFSAGGDVKAVYERRGDESFMRHIYGVEYQVNRLIARYPKPYVAFMDGITMGGGCGVSVHGSHRIVTESTTLAMPETAIGLFCDIAGAHFLSRAPGRVGEYLGLTGQRINGADAIWCGFADWFVRRDRRSDLIQRLRDGVDLEEAIGSLAEPPGSPPLGTRKDIIDRCFAAADVPGILRNLSAEHSEWADETRATLLRHSPFSLAVTLRLIREGRHKSVEDCLITDYRVALRFMERDDYFEGVRALLIERDTKPRWNPARIEEVDPEEVDRCFSPLPNGDLEFAQTN